VKIISVVGARPNFMKIAPFIEAIKIHNKNNLSSKIDHILVHTGQHYDNNMSEVFFQSLNIPEVDIHLNIGSGSHAEQVGQTMISFEKVLIDEDPDWVVVVGDVNATLACSITAKKEKVKVCHIEAGLRSGDMTMPEEINRIVTDSISDLLLTPDIISSKNLEEEGKDINKISFVGNIMIDTLDANINKASLLELNRILSDNLDSKDLILPTESIKDKYAVVTIHRPSNVDEEKNLSSLINFFHNIASKNHVLIWPVHPRTKKQLEKFNLLEGIENNKNIILLRPINYHEMLKLNMDAIMMFTDSGGLQEECCILGTPCITLRDSTERPITLRNNGGTSVLVGNDINLLLKEYKTALNEQRNPKRPPLWDGFAAERSVKALIDYSNLKKS
jgi:UDP-N-acetylglucosamine 2-epimerase (non-hydrolysing)